MILDSYLEKYIDGKKESSRIGFGCHTTSVTKLLKLDTLSNWRKKQRLTSLHKINTGGVKLNFIDDYGMNFVTRMTYAKSLDNPEGWYLQSMKLCRHHANKKCLLKSAMIHTVSAHLPLCDQYHCRIIHECTGPSVIGSVNDRCIVTKSPSVMCDMELHKAMLTFNPIMYNLCLYGIKIYLWDLTIVNFWKL